MTPLIELTGPAAALHRPDINTDIIAPLVRGKDGQQPVGLRSQNELAARLFGPWRYLSDGREDPTFVLNRQPFRNAKFLIAGPNFACGSSRETAATMLNAFGIRCVIAPSFGQIFHDNCFRNGMLPLELAPPVVAHLAAIAERGGHFTLDLRDSVLRASDGVEVRFELPLFRRQLLLSGRDEVAATLDKQDAIDAYRSRVLAARPWELKPGAH